MTVRSWSLALALAMPLLGVSLARGDDPVPIGRKAAKEAEKPAKEFVSFGTLKAPSLESARSQAQDWLKGVGKADDKTMKEFEALWNAQQDMPLLTRVSSTLALGDADAAKLLDQARDTAAPAPTEVPALLKDAKRPAFFRANLGLAYAKALSNRRVHEEALDVLRQVKPDQVVDPGAYFFHRAVAEHALLLSTEALRSITAVIEDVADAPDRYKMVSILMLYDMRTWKDKDLGWIARKMNVIERRLELSRGGPQTQKMQKEVVARLDEMIKKLEQQNKGGS